jgi:HPt (histidine-containing phosphotransfer) domain-containing protein
MKDILNMEAEDQVFIPKELNKIGRKNKAFTLRMLKLFLTTAKRCGKKIKSSIKENNWKELKSIAHKNIPTYCVMGLNELAEFLKYIDQHALNKNKHRSIQERFQEMNEKNTEAIDAVKKYIGLIRTENDTSQEVYSYGI